jgi:hypothetical protein
VATTFAPRPSIQKTCIPHITFYENFVGRRHLFLEEICLEAINFEGLHTRLLDLLRLRIRNGVVTERQLARITGVSQPHMHNVLKGVRYLSFQMTDQVLARLRLSVADLLEPADAHVSRKRDEETSQDGMEEALS